MSFKKDFNLFIGTQTGNLKGVKVGSDTVLVKNLRRVDSENRESEVTVMSWGDTDQVDVLIGTSRQEVKVFDSEFKAYSTSVDADFGKGPIVGISRFNGAIATCSESGHVKVWRYNSKEQIEIKIDKHVSKMRSADLNSGIIATGGRGNDLQLYSLETKKQLFHAKNVKKDYLELEKPVWVSDMAIIPDTEYKVAVATRHGEVRLYDSKACRRPVLNKEFPEQSFNTLSLCKDNISAVVGGGKGHIIHVDFRKTNKAVNTFKGFVGSVRQVVCHPTKPYLAGVGLDRFLRIYDMNTRNLLTEEYSKVKLNCILMRSNFDYTDENDEENEKEKTEANDEDSDVVILGSDDEYNDMFDGMETVKEKSKKRKFDQT